MKCVECVDYAECRKKHNLTIKRKHCPMAKVEYVQTNADRIRAMSDEELARWLEDIVPASCDCCIHQMPCRFEHDTETVDYTEKYHCGEGFLAWLKQPAE